MSAYTIDTNVFIDLQRNYPRDIFPSVWESIEALVDQAEACICGEVLEEAKRGNDGLFEYLRDYDGFACETTEEELKVVAAIGVLYPDWVRQEQNAADPFVIAHASVQGRTIVTQENGAKAGPSNPKIPNVAAGMGVTSLRLFDFVRAQGWTF